MTPGTPKSDSGPGSRFIDTVKKAWSARVKTSASVENNLNTNGHERLSKKGSQPTISESTPSVCIYLAQIKLRPNIKDYILFHLHI